MRWASFNHLIALVGVVVAVGRNNGLTYGTSVSCSIHFKAISRSSFDQSTPDANLVLLGMGLCGMFCNFFHVSGCVEGVGSLVWGADGGSMSCVTLSSSLCLLRVVMLLFFSVSCIAWVDRVTAA